jgi:hypothetical protein
MKSLASACLFGVLIGCAPVRPAHFVDTDIIQEIADDAPIPVPRKQRIGPLTYADAFGRRPIVDALDRDRAPDALDVNALDEAPPSSWLSLPAGGPLGAVREVVNGPPQAPFLVLSRRPESGRSGIVVIDARGLRYELGRDPVDKKGVRTAAAAIATRLLRALGYRTPEVSIMALDPKDLRLESIDGAPPPMEVVEDFLRDGPKPDGPLYRVSATRWPIGIDVGPTPPRDPREDDPNDRIAHPDRRTLRALKIVRAWLRVPDLGLTTLRDVYLGAPGKGHLLHFIVGLEGALGADDARGEIVEPRSIEQAPNPTANENPLLLWFTLGLVARVGHSDPRYPWMGDFDARLVDGDYRSAVVFEPAFRMLPADGYWMAKRLMAITTDVLSAAVDEGGLPTSERAHFVDMLEQRRLAVIARALEEVTPCEVVETRPHTVVLRDVGFRFRDGARYEINLLDAEGAQLRKTQVIAPGVAVFEVDLPPSPYLILRLRVARGQRAAPRILEAHFINKQGTRRLIGVRH